MTHTTRLRGWHRSRPRSPSSCAALVCTSRAALVVAACCALLVACGDDRTRGDAAIVGDALIGSDSRPIGTGAGAYGNCAGSPRRIDDAACADALACIPAFSRSSGEAQWCATACDPALDGADCAPAPSGSSARPRCLAVDPGDNYCVLSCFEDPESCPAGMVCFESWCAWAR